VDEVKPLHKLKSKKGLRIFRIMMLLLVISIASAIIIIAENVDSDTSQYSPNTYLYGHEAAQDEITPRFTPFPPITNIRATGTLGEGGAPWRLYYDGRAVVDSGIIRQSNTYWDGYHSYINSIVFTGPIEAAHIRGVFNHVSIHTIEGTHFLDTSGITNMDVVFAGLASLQSLDITTWNTNGVVSMTAMFDHSFLTQTGDINLNLSYWNTSRVEDMSLMFRNTRITNLNISTWNTDNVTNMANMFERTFRLSSLDLSNWETRNVTNMQGMFHSSGIVNLDLSRWDTRSVARMDNMFYRATSLRSLDISGWDTRNVMFKGHMFYSATSLRQITLGEHFRAGSGLGLPPVPQNNMYTGFWQNVGSGTTYHPRGEFIFTSEELMQNYDGGRMADTWVWQTVAAAQTVPSPQPTQVTLTFNPSPGTLPANTAASITNYHGFVITAFPTPVRSGYSFDGWVLGGGTVSLPFTLSANTVLTARWVPISANTVTVTFNPNQGGWPAGTQTSFTGQVGFSLQAFPTPTRAGFVFSGWSLNGVATVAPITVNQSMTLQATWTVAPSTSTPTPTPSSAPSSSPTPTSSPISSPSPSPSPGGTPAPRPNPQTSPMNMGLMFFGAVVLIGLAALCIISLSKKHRVKANQWEKDIARHNREGWVTDIVEK